MKRKTICRAEWSGIRKSTYTEKRFSAFGVSGMAGLILMDDAEDFSVPSPAGDMLITHTGYSWLSLAPENSSVWATVMFDENGELFEVYFDFTSGNHVEKNEKSYFYDLYLDVVYSPAADLVTVLDEDELTDAVRRGEVSAEQKSNALADAQKLLDFLSSNRFSFLDTCKNLREDLISPIK